LIGASLSALWSESVSGGAALARVGLTVAGLTVAGLTVAGLTVAGLTVAGLTVAGWRPRVLGLVYSISLVPSM